ncbi:unnamed protein product [Musa acuminata subsp. malaccensis]|uniref:(wild Malaysian banana) hypothetical protein n=1 Tax=Musa acuminata subsp. malaccensis TaxID=214687 RepID=A0A804HSE1_MUSAM|nr:unnamed protein product [Musa acuminata subsp. malaccensis]
MARMFFCNWESSVPVTEPPLSKWLHILILPKACIDESLVHWALPLLLVAMVDNKGPH